MNKPVYLDLSVLGLSKTVMYEFWCYYVKPNFNEDANFFYMDTDSFIVQVNTYDIDQDTTKDVEIRFQIRNYTDH